mgnify:CR=1 FL=1
MEKFVIQLTIDGILNQANQVFGDLLSGTMDMVGKITESFGSITAGL